MEATQAHNESVGFREYLRNELLKRCRNNPRYSLRAFARYLGLESSYLSKILQGKRSVTEALIDKLQCPLALSPLETQGFKQHAKKQRGRKHDAPPKPLDNFNLLTLDTFYLISDWYHYAILELTNVDGFQSDVKWIGRCLGLPVPVIQNAIERLERFSLIAWDESGKRWKSTGNNTTTGNRFTTSAFRKLQRDILEMALTALEEVPLEQRDQSSITIAIDTNRLNEAKEVIKLFRRRFAASLEEGAGKNAVYQLSVSFYPVTKNMIEPREKVESHVSN